MKALINVNNSGHQREHATWMAEGLGRHGVEVVFGLYNGFEACDLLIIWGVRQQAAIAQAREAGVPVLVMERGHLQPRLHWTSIGWDGLCRRGRYPKAADCEARPGDRFVAHFGRQLQPWRDVGSATALVLGQVPGDMSMLGQDIRVWAQTATDFYQERGWRVAYRRHPLVVRANDSWCPVGAELDESPSLEAALEGATVAVHFSSTAGVEAALFGVPVIACDEGAMAWPVAGHGLGADLVRPDRFEWCADLAWAQWTPEEIASGEAWQVVRNVGVGPYASGGVVRPGPYLVGERSGA